MAVEISNLPVSTPDLMPFNIAYNGSAPISTYMLLEERQTDNLDLPASDLNGEPKDDGAALCNGHEEKSLLRRAASYLVSAFRGRVIHGTRVPLPSGYVGVVLRRGPEEEGHGASTHAKRATRNPRMEPVDTPRSTRRSAKKAAEEAVPEDETEAMEVDEEQPSNPLLALTSTSTFTNFTLWLPDNRTRELSIQIRDLKDPGR